MSDHLFTAEQLSFQLAALAGLSALVVTARAPRWLAVERWVATAPGRRDAATDAHAVEDHTGHVRAFLTRTSLRTFVLFIALLLPSLLLKAAGPSLALTLAVLLGAAGAVDGGRTRRVDLHQASGPSPRAATAIKVHVSWSALVAAAALGLWALGLARAASLGYFPSGPGTSLPDLERWTLPVLAACAVLPALALPLAARQVRYRRALPGVSPAVDAALRTVSLRRCLLGAETANLVLTGALLTAVPLLSTTADPALVRAAGVVGTVVVGAAMVRLAVGLLRWAPRRSPAPLQPARG